MGLKVISRRTGHEVALEHAIPGDWLALRHDHAFVGWRYVSSGEWCGALEVIDKVGWSRNFARRSIPVGGYSVLIITDRTKFFGVDRFGAIKVDAEVLRRGESSEKAEVMHLYADTVPIEPEFYVEMDREVTILNRGSIPLLLLAAESGGLRLAKDAWLKVEHPASRKYPQTDWSQRFVVSTDI